MMVTELPLLICLLTCLSRVSAQYDPGPIRVGVPVKLGPTGNFVTAYNFEDFLSSAPPKQYVATVLTNNQAISTPPASHSLPPPHHQRTAASPASHNGGGGGGYVAIVDKQNQLRAFAQPVAAYTVQATHGNNDGQSLLPHNPRTVGVPTGAVHAGPVSSDGTIHLPKERVSVSSFPSMQEAKDAYGEQIKLDPTKFRKELDNVEWREEIVFPRPGPSRIKWNPKTYTEDERIVKARNNRYVYAEFRDGSGGADDGVLEQTGHQIQPSKVKPSLNLRTTHATTQYDPNRNRQWKAHIPGADEQAFQQGTVQEVPHGTPDGTPYGTLHGASLGNPQRKVVYKQQHFRAKEEEQLRSQFGYTGRDAQPREPVTQDHEVRYYPQKHTGDRDDPSSEVDYERAFRGEPQLKSHRNSQFQTTSDSQSPEEDPRTPRSALVEYATNGYDAPKGKILKHQKDDEHTAGIQQAVYEDSGDSSDLVRPRDVHVYRAGRQDKQKQHHHHQHHHRYQEDEPEQDERLVHKRKVPKYVTQENVGKASREDLEEYFPQIPKHHKQSERSSNRKKLQRHRLEYRPDPDSLSEEVPMSHGQSYAARSESPRHVRVPKYTSESPRKYTSTRSGGAEIMRYKKKKRKPVYYDDEDEEGEIDETEHQKPRRFNIRFENNPGEPFSFRKDSRKGHAVDDVDETEDDHEDRISLYEPSTVLRSLVGGSGAGESGVKLSFKLA